MQKPKVSLFVMNGCEPCDELKKGLPGRIQDHIDFGSEVSGKPSVKVYDLAKATDDLIEEMERLGVHDVPTAVIEQDGQARKCGLYREGDRIKMDCSG